MFIKKNEKNDKRELSMLQRNIGIVKDLRDHGYTPGAIVAITNARLSPESVAEYLGIISMAEANQSDKAE